MNQIQERFRLEMELLRLERQAQENEAALRQAACDLWESQTAQALYSGSFRSLRDKLTGKKEETETALRHNVANATTALTAARQEKSRLALRTEEVRSQLDALPPRDALREQAEGDALREWYRLDALYCIGVLIPLAEINRELLTERRAQFNGTYAGQVKTWQELSDIYSAPEAAGEACKPYILRLQKALDTLGIPFEMQSYFDAPTAFLSSATKYTRMDRINTAIAQTEKLQQYLSDLNNQLER